MTNIRVLAAEKTRRERRRVLRLFAADPIRYVSDLVQRLEVARADYERLAEDYDVLAGELQDTKAELARAKGLLLARIAEDAPQPIVWGNQAGAFKPVEAA